MMSAFSPSSAVVLKLIASNVRYQHTGSIVMTEQLQDPKPPKSTTVSFGERMKREREMRGVKLEEIVESTKIGKRNLVALEEEQFDQLPGGIFNKGFVRAYAKYLGLDEEQAVNDFMVASANYDQPAALQPPPTSWVKAPAMPSDEAVRRRNRLRVVLAAVLLVGGFIAWFYWKGYLRAAEDAGDQQTTRTATSNAASAEANSQSEPSNALPANTPAVAEIAPGRGVFTIKIQAKEDSWVNVTSDGKQVMDIVIPAGQQRTIHARQELVLKIGNAGGIEVAHNGVPMGPFGAEREVKTLTFNAKGLAH